MKLDIRSALVATPLLLLWACGGDEASHDHPHPHEPEAEESVDDGSESAVEDEHEHDHDEVELGTAKVGEYEVELAQGHGPLVAGEESHLVVKLPFNDKGSTVVRAWIGSEDRLLSFVGKGDYAESHDDYDIHAIAPTPLPSGVMWWIEIEKPDGTKLVGSAKPIL